MYARKMIYVAVYLAKVNLKILSLTEK